MIGLSSTLLHQPTLRAKFVSGAKMESLHEFLPDPSAFGLPAFDPSFSRGHSRGGNILVVQN